MAVTPGIDNVDSWVRQHPDADPKTLLDIVLAETELIREEYRGAAEVELDDKGNFKPSNLAGLWRLGKLYSASELVPAHYRGPQKVADCTIGVQMALRCGVDILTFLQGSYIVKGTPGIKATLAIGMINGSGQIKGRIKFKQGGEGDDRWWTAYATDKDGDVLEAKVDWRMVRAEGWDQPKGTQVSKWVTMADQMGKYRAAMFLARTNFPDVLMGMYTDDELEDIHGVPVGSASAQAQSAGVQAKALEKAKSDMEQLFERHEREAAEASQEAQGATESEASQDPAGEEIGGEAQGEAAEQPGNQPGGNGGKKKQGALIG